MEPGRWVASTPAKSSLPYLIAPGKRKPQAGHMSQLEKHGTHKQTISFKILIYASVILNFGPVIIIL